MKENEFLSVYIDKSYDALVKKYTTKNIKIEADYFIDATSDGALSLMSGCKNINKENKHQYSTLRFIVENVDIKRLAKYIKKHRKSEMDEPVYKIKNDIHLSTAYIYDTKEKWSLNKVFEKALKKNLLTKDDIAYFQIFTVANRKNAIAFNCPRIYQNNDTIKNKSLALIEGRKRLYKLFSFCKENIEGFKNSYISEIANSLGVRVSNMIEGEYIYTKDDMISSKRFKNEVLKSEYPIDIHDKNSTIEPKNATYFLPIESIKSKDTEIERILRKALHDRGYGYRKNYKALPGCPDIVLSKYQIEIFCDSEFFHGKDWDILKPKLENGKNSEFWINKITKNIERDDLVNKELLYLNWTVIRFWGKEIKKHPETCIKVIEEVIFEKKMEKIEFEEEL